MITLEITIAITTLAASPTLDNIVFIIRMRFSSVIRHFKCFKVRWILIGCQMFFIAQQLEKKYSVSDSNYNVTIFLYRYSCDMDSPVFTFRMIIKAISVLLALQLLSSSNVHLFLSGNVTSMKWNACIKCINARCIYLIKNKIRK